MAAKQSNFELKVGLFAFIGLLILFMIVFSIGDFYLLNPGYTLTLRFKSAHGLEIGAPVHVAGVISGEVKGVSVRIEEGKTHVDLLVWLREGTLVSHNSEARIKTLGLLGEKFVDIYPGEHADRFLQEGERLEGVDPVSMDELLERGYLLVGRLEDSADSLHRIMSQVEQGEGTLGKLLMNDALYLSLEEFIEDIRRHPWKLLRRGKEEDSDKEKSGNQGFIGRRR